MLLSQEEFWGLKEQASQKYHTCQDKTSPWENGNVLLTSKLSRPLGRFPTNWERFHLVGGGGEGRGRGMGRGTGAGNSFKIVSGTLPFIPKLWTLGGLYIGTFFSASKSLAHWLRVSFPSLLSWKLYEPWTVPWLRVFYFFCRVHTQQHYKARGVYL